MRTIDHRRHAMRDPGGVHLNAAGLALARHVGSASGRYDRVVTSPIPRAMETGAAIAGRVDQTLEELATLGTAVERALGPIVTWADVARAERRAPVVRRFGATQHDLLRAIARALPEDGRALVVSHGGVVELGAVAALPTAEHDTWGGPVGYCEGIRMEHDGDRFVRGRPLRIEPSG